MHINFSALNVGSSSASFDLLDSRSNQGVLRMRASNLGRGLGVPSKHAISATVNFSSIRTVADSHTQTCCLS